MKPKYTETNVKPKIETYFMLTLIFVYLCCIETASSNIILIISDIYIYIYIYIKLKILLIF